MSSFSHPSHPSRSEELSPAPLIQEAYRTIRGGDVTPDFGIVRRYEPFFRGIEICSGNSRHQIVLTDDVEKTHRLIAQYILHAQDLAQLFPQGILSGLSSLLMASSEEACGIGSQGLPDKKRTTPRSYSEIVRIEVGAPHFEELLESIYHSIPDKRKRPRTPFNLLTDRTISGAFVDFFEANTEKVLFVATLTPPSSPVAAEKFYKDFSQALYRLEDDSWDHRDVLYRVPPVIWLLPYKLVLPSEPLWILTGSKHYFFNRPYQEWLSYADSCVPRPQNLDEESVKRYSFGLHTNRLNVVGELRPYHTYLQRLLESKGSREGIESHTGISLEDISYLLQQDFCYDYSDTSGPWYADKDARMQLGIS